MTAENTTPKRKPQHRTKDKIIGLLMLALETGSGGHKAEAMDLAKQYGYVPLARGGMVEGANGELVPAQATGTGTIATPGAINA